jgi:hypothetical protein
MAGVPKHGKARPGPPLGYRLRSRLVAAPRAETVPRGATVGATVILGPRHGVTSDRVDPDRPAWVVARSCVHVTPAVGR